MVIVGPGVEKVYGLWGGSRFGKQGKQMEQGQKLLEGRQRTEIVILTDSGHREADVSFPNLASSVLYP